MQRDRLRQGANMVLAFAQPVVTILAFALGTSFEEATDTGVGKTLIEPANYTFIIWSVIYLGTMIYAVYQALPSQRETALFRRIGWFTASSFLSVLVWLIAARFALIYVTVVCIVWMLASLVFPFREFIRGDAQLTTVQRLLVVLPFSIFLGWVSVATFANSAAALKTARLLDVGLSEEGWTVVMILVAGLVGSVITYRSGGNAGYGLTLMWALVGIGVADQMRRPPTAITPTAASMTVLIAVVLLAAGVLKRLSHRSALRA